MVLRARRTDKKLNVVFMLEPNVLGSQLMADGIIDGQPAGDRSHKSGDKAIITLRASPAGRKRSSAAADDLY